MQYELDGDLGPLVNCHCRFCRHVQGAAFVTVAMVRTGDLRFVTGEGQVRECQSGEGSRFFCGQCGGRLFNRPASNADITMLLVATLDEEPLEGPVMHINTESKAPWYEIRDELPQFPGMPPRPGG